MESLFFYMRSTNMQESVLSGSPMEKVGKAIIPFLLANMIVVALVTYIPSITLCIPALFK